MALFPSYGAAGVLSDYSWNVVDFPCFEDIRDHFVQSVMFLHWLLCICILFPPRSSFPFLSFSLASEPCPSAVGDLLSDLKLFLV